MTLQISLSDVCHALNDHHPHNLEERLCKIEQQLANLQERVGALENANGQTSPSSNNLQERVGVLEASNLLNTESSQNLQERVGVLEIANSKSE
jgi:hypothetical protein